MATLIPPTCSDSAPWSERTVWAALAALSDEWLALHSVTWQAKRNGRQGDGEADFVVVHPAHGIIILEVKGGGVEINRGRWYQTNTQTGVRRRMKNPFEQARASKYALIGYFQQLDPPLEHVPIQYAVVFPGTRIPKCIGAYGPRPTIVDQDDLENLDESLRRVFSHWEQESQIPSHEIEQIVALLAPTITIRVGLRSQVHEAKQQQIQLTNQQVQSLNQLRRIRRAHIVGSAGTGKTVLAVARAKRLAKDNFETLLVCYNEPLANYLNDQVLDEPKIRATHFHKLCMQEARAANVVIPQSVDEEWWESSAPEVLIDAAAVNDTQFDAIVVDEAQDFSDQWIDALQTLTRKPTEAPIYVFGDSHQQLYRRRVTVAADWPEVVLEINCRNTLQIAKRVSSIFGDACETLGARGVEPTFELANFGSDGMARIADYVTGLVEIEHIAPEELIVLSDSKSLIVQLRTMIAGDHAFTSLDGTGIRTETVHRFKGLEADIVILAITDQFLQAEDQLARVLYIGMSRARGHLVVFGSQGVKQFLQW